MAALRGTVIALAAMILASGAALGAAQTGFADPEQAVQALVAAVRANDVAKMQLILGPGSGALIKSGDPVADRTGRARFVAAYDARHRIDRVGEKATLIIGENDFPMAIPIVAHQGSWRFDARAGREEILDRRIGQNELDAIEVCRAYVEAQRDYASADRTGSGVLEYARHFISRPGKHDGLYWPAAVGVGESPLGPLMAKARAAGYGGKGTPYHGYFYKILTAQGPHAPGGARDYIVNGHMIGGFALVAFPAKHGDSGVMTFLVDRSGVVRQKNLGRNSAAIARAMTRYDPDASWTTP